MTPILLAEQSEYMMMYLLVALFVLLGTLSVGIPRFRRTDLLTEEEKKKQVAPVKKRK